MYNLGDLESQTICEYYYVFFLARIYIYIKERKFAQFSAYSKLIYKIM